MTDPYSVLGVSPGSTDDQIKKAYRELAKKYHPDVNSDAGASEKMKEINEAYDLIMKMRESGNNGRYYNGGQNTSSSSSYSSDAFNIYRAQTLIAMGRYAEARIVLDSIPQASRDAEWYYIYGVLLNNSGAYFDARAKFEEAVRLDPSNPIYRQALNRVGAQGAYRNSSPGGYSSSGDCCGNCSGCDVCTGLMCADCLCECCGGDLIRCC